MRTISVRVADEIYARIEGEAKTAQVSLSAFCVSRIVGVNHSDDASKVMQSDAQPSNASILAAVESLREAVMQMCITSDAKVMQSDARVHQSDAEVMQSDSLGDALAHADDMDADGDERTRGSNFQKRRKRQMELLQQAWAELMPEKPKLQDATMKHWLGLCDNNAFPVYEFIGEMAERKIESPIGYADKVLTARKVKREQTTAAAAAIPTVVEHRYQPSNLVGDKWRVAPEWVDRERWQTARETYEEGCKHTYWRPSPEEWEKMYPGRDYKEMTLPPANRGVS